MTRARGGGHVFQRFTVAAIFWLAGMAGCADQWLPAPPGPEHPGRCPQGTILDPRQGTCTAASCSADDHCPAGEICESISGSCRPAESLPPGPGDPPCGAGSFRCDAGGGRQVCDGTRWIALACPSGGRCVDGACLPCEPDAQRCAADGAPAYEICDGKGWRRIECGDPTAWCEAGRCRLCEPGESRCTEAGQAVCSPGGTEWLVSACPTGSHCAEVDGKTSCVALACTPRESRCHPDAPEKRLVCPFDGSGLVEIACGTGSECREPGGRCLDACALAALDRSGAGCEYWFTHLPNGADLHGVTAGLSLVVSNPGSGEASLSLLARGASMPLASVRIGAGDRAEIAVPWNAPAGSGIFGSGYRLVSTAPVLAHLISRAAGTDRSRCIAAGCYEPPCGQEDVCAFATASADATLLLPVHLLADHGGASTYYAWSPRHQHEVYARPASLALVGTRDGSQIVIDSQAVTVASTDGTFPAMGAGERIRLRLDAGQVLRLVTAPAGRCETLIDLHGIERGECLNDFGGTRIVADAPLAVFAGADSARIPFAGAFSDHLEEQLLPVSLWGARHIGLPRGGGDRFVVLAGESPTEVRWSREVVMPAGEAIDALLIRARGTFEFRAEADFEILSDGPIGLLQIVGGGPDGVGPALLAIPPLERSRSNYHLPIAPGGKTELHLVAPSRDAGGAIPTVVVAGKAIDDWTPLEKTELRTARIQLCAGPSSPCNPEGALRLHSTEAFGLVVHEGGEAGSAFAGGLGDLPSSRELPDD